MTQIWKGEERIAVTKVEAGPCTVVQAKNREKDGYAALQIGFGRRKAKHTKKPQAGHTKGLANFRYLREFRLDRGPDSDPAPALKRGDTFGVSSFSEGDEVKVTGVSKGKGFQGVVKRHGFHGHNSTHGTKDQVRMPGSIGATEPAHVFKGMRMAGHMGNRKSTVSNLSIIEIDERENLLYIKGALPGSRNSLVLISGPGEIKAGGRDEQPAEEQAAPAEETRDATSENAGEAIPETATEPSQSAGMQDGK